VHRNIFLIILLVVIAASLVCGLSQGRTPDGVNGWIFFDQTVGQGKVKRCRKKRSQNAAGKTYGYWAARTKTWQVPLARSLVLLALWELSGRVGTVWLQVIPWLIWLLPGEGRLWSKIKQGMWEVQRAVILTYAGLSLWHLFHQANGAGLMLGCLVCGADEPKVTVERTEDGDWQATLSGRFTVRVGSDHPFRLRLLLIFLGQIQSEDEHRRSRRTRDGRTPFVRQEQLAAWTDTKQEHISLWMRHWLKGDWAHLLSLHTPEVLTNELMERIVTVLATFPGWSEGQIYQHLRKQGLEVSHTQIEEASQRSGWDRLKTTLAERYDLRTGLHLRDEWLVKQLLHQIQELLNRIEAGSGLTPEIRTPVQDLQAVSAQAGAVATRTLPVQPWLQTLECCLFGQWEDTTTTNVQCTYCQSKDVAPKSKKPRRKKFYAADGTLQDVAVYRYYCHNPLCLNKSFTYLPSGLLPYSHYRAQSHLLVLQMYAWGHSTYRRTGTAIGISSMTAWRWVSAWGHALLPMAALFGVVRSSGVVGVDEKYVLVPKNDKPAAKMRRWMYVYLAVDVWTSDLLHLEIYPYNDDDSAKAFLLALRAKGYHPQVIVTDLRQDYGPCITLVFPDASHHECIFHALQNAQKHLKDVYGPLYAQNPQAVLLKQQIYAIFDTDSPTEACSRYQQVLQLKEAYLQATPTASVIFDFLEKHWPRLVNAIGSETIPTTNNATERVICRFDQHYQNFCGFDSLESAQAYLAVFEKLYRFTPFSQDAQPRIRGKSPLQLAGYDVSQFPMSTLCEGLSIDWPTEVNLVPN
jgi:hypothetical protein